MAYSLQEVPRFTDKLSWLYVEHGVLSRDNDGVFFADGQGRTPIPLASLALLMLGPGTRATHRSMQAIAEMNCLVVWVGEQGTRLYAHGTGGTSHANRLRRQARIWASPRTHMLVVRRMYEIRFDEELPPDLALQQIRGREGMRVRRAYERLAKEAGIVWNGRKYDPRDWNTADLPNRCLSVANAALYGLVHAALVAVGYSPALGFVHTGRPRSFVYDIADLCKFETVVPTAFAVAAANPQHVERAVRQACRDSFREANMMERIMDLVETVLDVDLKDIPDPTEHSWGPVLPAEPGPDD
jgi:CRISPR-associated protein Cas1